MFLPAYLLDNRRQDKDLRQRLPFLATHKMPLYQSDRGLALSFGRLNKGLELHCLLSAVFLFYLKELSARDLQCGIPAAGKPKSFRSRGHHMPYADLARN